MPRVKYYAEIIWKGHAKKMSTERLKSEIKKYVLVRDYDIKLNILKEELESRKNQCSETQKKGGGKNV